MPYVHHSTNTKVQLKTPYLKMLCLYPTLNNTFVFLAVKEMNQYCVTHVDKQGTVLFEYFFPKPIEAAGMMDQRQLILLQTRSKWNLAPQNAEQHGPCITILDLETHKFKRITHNFLNEQSDLSYIRCFAQTKYLCIQENGGYNENRFKLSYYQYPLKQDDKPFNVYESKGQEWTPEYIVKQANHNSMIAWFKPRHDNEWEFKTYDLRDDPKGNLNIYKIKQTIGIFYGMKVVQVAMNTMWQTTKGSFMFVCISNKTDNQKNKQLGVIQNNYIFDVAKNEVRESNCSFGQFHTLLIDQTNLGDICMFRTFDFVDGKPLTTPIYYLENKTQEIIYKGTWQCSPLHKDQLTGVDKNMLIHNKYQNSDVDWFQCEKICFKSE